MATLEKIRKRSVLLLIVIAVALLAFIIGDALTNSRQIFGNGTTVAQVGSNKIDLMEYQRRVSEANEQLRNTPNAPDGQALQQMVLEQMVAEALLDEAVGKMGVRVGGDLLRIYMFNAQIPEVQLIMQQLNQAGVPVQTPEQAWNAIFNPQQYGKTAQDMESFRQAWIAAESSAKKGMARELYQGALAGAFQPNDIDRQMLAQDFNTQVKANYAFKPYGNLDAKQYPVSDQDKQAAYDELKHMYKVEAPTKSVAFIRVDVTPSQSDLNASKALAAKTRGELARGGQLGRDTKKAGVATERHTLRAVDISDQAVRNFVATAPQDSLLTVYNDIKGFEIIRMGERKAAVDSIQINLVATAGGALPQRVLAALNSGLGLDSLYTTGHFSQDSVIVAQKEYWVQMYGPAGPTEAMEQSMLDTLRSAAGRYVILQSDPKQGALIGKIVKENAPVEVYSYEDITYALKPGTNTLANAQQKLGNFLADNNTAKAFLANAAKKGFNVSQYDLSQNSPAIPVFEGGQEFLPDSRQVVRWVMIDGKKGEVSPYFESKDLLHPQLYAVAITDEFDDYMPVTHRHVAPMVEQYARNSKAGDAWVKQYNKGNAQASAKAMGQQLQAADIAFNPFGTGGVADHEVVGKITGSKKGQYNIVKGRDGVYVYQVLDVKNVSAQMDDAMYTQMFQQFNGINPQNPTGFIFNALKGKKKVKNNVYQFEAGK